MTELEKMTEQHNLIYYNYMDQNLKTNRDYESGKITEDEFHKISHYHYNVYRKNLLRKFETLSWQEQIYFCIATGQPLLVDLLDEDQLATMKIVA
jgi:hypothetical protein